MRRILEKRRRTSPAAVARWTRLSVEALEDREAPAVVTWIGGSGDWNNGSNWDTGLVPGSNDHAVIDKPDILVIHSAGTNSIQSLTIANNAFELTGGTLDVAGVVEGGTVLQLKGGTLANATVDGATNVLVSSSGSLRSVTINSVLNLAYVASAVSIYEGLTLNGVAYLGTPSSSGALGDLVFDGTQTLDGTGTVVFGGAPGNDIRVVSSNTTLTIAPGITIKGKYGAFSDGDGINNVQLINHGTIYSNAGGTIRLLNDSWINHGSIIGGSLELYGNWSTTTPLQLVEQGIFTLSGTWTNELGIHVEDSELRLEGFWTNLADITAVNSRVFFGSWGSEWTNLGSVNLIDCVTSLGTFNKTFTLAELGDFNRSGGTVFLHGTLDNTNTTLQFNAELGSWYLTGGQIHGGTITSADGERLLFSASGGRLKGVVMAHDMDLTVDSAFVEITNGIRFTNINIALGNAAESGAQLKYIGTQSWTGTANLVAGSKSTNAIFGSGSLTLGPGITIRGHSMTLGNVGGGLVTQGTVWADQPGGSFWFGAENLTNFGTIKASNGASLVLTNTWNTTSPINFSGNGNLTLDGSWTYGFPLNFTGQNLTLNGTWTYGFPLDFTGQNLTLGGAFTWTGPLSAVDAVVKIGTNANWSNTGVISVDQCDVTLGGIYSVNSLGTFQRIGGTVSHVGFLNNDNQTLNLNATTGSWVLSGGTIAGGIIQESEGAYLYPTAAGGLLSGFVTFNGDLDLSHANTVRVDVSGELTLNGTAYIGNAAGTTMGVLNIAGGTLLTSSAATIVFGGSTPNTFFVQEIGPNVTVRGKNGTIFGGVNFTNLGLIQADTLGGTIAIIAYGWNNSGGTIHAINGANLTLNGSFTITSPLSINGGGTLSLIGAWSNTSAVSAVGGRVNLGLQWSTMAWSNSGTISITDTILYLYGAMSTPGLGDIQRSGGTIYLAGDLNNAGSTLTMNNETGDWIVEQATIVGGTVHTSGADLLVRYGELHGVTWIGNMDLSQFPSSVVELDSSFRLDGTAYVGNAFGTTIAQIRLYSTTISSNSTATFVFGAHLSNEFSMSGLVTLTPAVTVTGKSAQFEAGASFVNQGTIVADDADSFFEFKFGTFVNQGLLRAADGATIRVGGSWSNTGTIEVINGNFEMGGSFTTAGLGTLVRSGGFVSLHGILTNTGNILAFNSLTGSWLLLNGTIMGGIITHSDGAALIPTSLSGTLNGVTINGDLDLTQGSGVSLIIWNGLTLNGAAYLGNQTGASDGNLTFSGSQTLGTATGAVIVFGGHTGNGILGSGASSQTLTIGPNVTVRGKNGRITTGNMTLVNHGTISADTQMGVIQLIGKAVNNVGVLNASKGGTLSAEGITGTFTNSGQVTIGPRSKLALLGAYTQTAGATTLQRGQFSATTVNIMGGTLSGTGVVIGNVVNAGQLLPGGPAKAGMLVIKGDYTELGTLVIDIGGTAAGVQHDRLVVQGTAILTGGSLSVGLIDGFVPDPNVPDTFGILSFTLHAPNDEFNSYIGLDLGGGLSLQPVYGPNELTLVTSLT